ncbi:hypothetical protein D3C72_1248390 [compost metagenome]
MNELASEVVYPHARLRCTSEREQRERDRRYGGGAGRHGDAAYSGQYCDSRGHRQGFGARSVEKASLVFFCERVQAVSQRLVSLHELLDILQRGFCVAP